MQDRRTPTTPATPPVAATSRWRRSSLVTGAAVALGVGALVVKLASASQPQLDPPTTTNRGASAPEPSPATSSSASDPAIDARVALGRRLFFDANLSDPPGTSCATCHEPSHAFAGNNGSDTGVAKGSRPHHFARRNTPSLLYLRFVPHFAFRWEEDVNLPDAIGGFFWDGRSDSIASLVKQPLFNPNEMNARDARQVDDKLKVSAYAAAFRDTFGPALDDPDAAVGAAGAAIESFLLSDTMAPFSSKYDDVVRGRAAFTPLEAHGLALFKDRAKGACDACHKLNEASRKPERSLFTDFGFEAVGAPRNRRATAQSDPKAYDLGLCERHDHAHMDEERLCGSFRTPSLRNVAVRPSFMHNGAFSNLRDVVAFYATRGTDPKRWYASGTAFDDLPEKYRSNVNKDRVPYDRGTGETPRLDDSEIDAIVAFLQTLTDSQYR